MFDAAPNAAFGDRLVLQLPNNRMQMPRVRLGQTHSTYNRVQWEGRVRTFNQEDAWVRYELLNGFDAGVYQVITYGPRGPDEDYIHVRRGLTYDVRSISLREVAESMVLGQMVNPNHVKMVRQFSAMLPIDYDPDNEETQVVSRRRFLEPIPGPIDRFDRILNFGVKDADPEPPIEEVLDKVEMTSPRKKVEIPEDELLQTLEKVVAPERGHVQNSEFEELLRSIK